MYPLRKYITNERVDTYSNKTYYIHIHAIFKIDLSQEIKINIIYLSLRNKIKLTKIIFTSIRNKNYIIGICDKLI